MSRTLRLSLGVIMLVGGSACAESSAEDAATGCRAVVRAASLAAEPADQVRLLDRALGTCRSYEALTAEIDKYPSMLGYDTATFVERRCANVDDDGIRSGPACSDVVAPVTAPPETTIVELVFVGDTLDGRQVEIRPGPTIEFVGEVPAIIQQTVDIALEAGCEGVIAQRDLWASRVVDGPAGDIASVYAQHAQNVANYIRCDTAALDG